MAGSTGPESPRTVLPILFTVVALDYAGVGQMRTLLPFLARRHSSSAALIGSLLRISARLWVRYDRTRVGVCWLRACMPTCFVFESRGG